MKRDEIVFESSDDMETSAVNQKDALGSQLFTNKGKPKVFSWGDAALTANIASEKVSQEPLLLKFVYIYILYIRFIISKHYL